MTRLTTLTGWWLTLLRTRAKGNVALLASLCEVEPRTLTRWACGDIALPAKQHRIQLRKVAGEDLLNNPKCPKYLRAKPKVQHVS